MDKISKSGKKICAAINSSQFMKIGDNLSEKILSLQKFYAVKNLEARINRGLLKKPDEVISININGYVILIKDYLKLDISQYGIDNKDLKIHYNGHYYITMYDGRFAAIMAGIARLANRVDTISHTLAVGCKVGNCDDLLICCEWSDISRFLSKEEIRDATCNFISEQRDVWEGRFTKALEYINDNF